MSPPTARDNPEWDGNAAQGWTVMGTLREHRAARIRQDAESQRRFRQQLDRRRETHPYDEDRLRPWNPVEPRPAMLPARSQEQYETAIAGRWHGGPTLLAFLFAHPDSDAIRSLDARGEYFDVRTGDWWDLFFPGYYRSAGDGEGQHAAVRVGRDYAGAWYFSAGDFNAMRDHVERASGRRWQYSGGSDLVLVNGWLPEEGEPTIDWASTIAGPVTDEAAGTRTLTLAGIVEKVSRDFEAAAEDPDYGVREVTGTPARSDSHVTRDFMLSTLSGMAAALGARAVGL